jgi:hypothetical protein
MTLLGVGWVHEGAETKGGEEEEEEEIDSLGRCK